VQILAATFYNKKGSYNLIFFLIGELLLLIHKIATIFVPGQSSSSWLISLNANISLRLQIDGDPEGN
jgi:hypothetical protein